MPLGLRSTRGTLGFQPGDSETPLASLLAESKWRCPLDSCDWVAGAFSEAPLLVIDAFDMLGAASPVALTTLLHGLRVRAMLPGMGDGLGALHAVIVAGPPSILDIKTTDRDGRRLSVERLHRVHTAAVRRRGPPRPVRRVGRKRECQCVSRGGRGVWRVSSHSRTATGAGA